ncbi:hypothetical protein BDQ17DRAFT_1434294 [Cyathus striatus]|nr:hypothetical protein BDQ17DRAFT_1434294 [Cyathus striatus]
MLTITRLVTFFSTTATLCAVSVLAVPANVIPSDTVVLDGPASTVVPESRTNKVASVNRDFTVDSLGLVLPSHHPFRWKFRLKMICLNDYGMEMYISEE